MQTAGVIPTIPVTETLRMDELSRVTIRAYKRLHAAGQIAIQFPIIVHPGIITIKYLSSLPAEWMRQTIIETANQGRATLEAERDKMVARLEMLLQANREDLLPQIQTSQARYMEINEILEA